MEVEKKSPEQIQEETLVGYWYMQFKDSMVAKAPYTKRWATYWDAYRGDYFKNTSLPDYKSNLVSNYIFSIVETIRPIMFDKDPKFQALPRQAQGMQYANDWQEVLSYEWDRESMTTKFIREAITLLVTGTSILFLPWNSQKKNVKPVFINPDNFFVDPLATSVEDMGYGIYAKYVHKNILKRGYPQKADRFSGANVNFSELVQGNNANTNTNDQVLVLEIWARDHESIVENVETGEKRLKYPNGRVLTLCPELGIVLEDKANPYNDGELPFYLIKDYDVPGKFWGEGEIAQLISPQKYLNELNNAILDNAKLTANSPWIIDKNSGIGEGKITSRQGLIIRKNPGTEVRREQPANMPNYVVNAVETYKHDMEQVSGIFDSLKGNSETGVYTAQGILALQEAGQARIRLKVKLLEQALSDIATGWHNRIKQFWKDDRFIAITRFDGTYDVKQFKQDARDHEYDIKITAGSTMPVNRGAMLDLMIRLAQTPMPDGQNLVDREAVVQYLPEEAKAPMLQRMNGQNTQVMQQIQQLSEQLQQNEQGDQQTLQALQNVTSALEQMKQEILQLGEQHAKVEEEKAKQEETTKIKDDAYNMGYADAEKIASPSGDDATSQDTMSADMMGSPNEAVAGKLPDDILVGLQSMSDDELALLLEQHPDLQDLIK
jgi:hypothetical protein